MIVNKGKQKEDKVQDKKVFLYKLYNISLKSNKPKTSEPKFVQDKVTNLEKAIVLIQSPTKTIPFYLPPNYKTLWPNRKQNEQY